MKNETVKVYLPELEKLGFIVLEDCQMAHALGDASGVFSYMVKLSQESLFFNASARLALTLLDSVDVAHSNLVALYETTGVLLGKEIDEVFGLGDRTLHQIQRKRIAKFVALLSVLMDAYLGDSASMLREYM